MATQAQQEDTQHLVGCRVREVTVDGGLAYLRLEAPTARCDQAVVLVRIVEIEWCEDERRPS